jgi:hypothetical protein
VVALLASDPNPGRCHFVDLEVTVTPPDEETINGRVQFIRGRDNRFRLEVSAPWIDQLCLGQGRCPWLASGSTTVFRGSDDSAANPLQFVSDQNRLKLQTVIGAITAVSLTPDMLRQVVTLGKETTAAGSEAIRISQKGKSRDSMLLTTKGDAPQAIDFNIDGVRGRVKFRVWRINTLSQEALFDPPPAASEQVVDAEVLRRIWSALANFGIESLQESRRSGTKSDALSVVARDPAGHGLLCESQGQRILIVSGTPEQMGAAHGALLREDILRTIERVMYLVGGADTMRSGVWFLDRMEEIHRRTLPHMPPRLLAECDALSRTIGISEKQGRYTNLFPERFHCSGVAVRGKASVGGQVLHARVLDYMRDIHLQDAAVVVAFLPEGRNAWMSLGYAGFVGTVTAMNEKGLAIGKWAAAAKATGTGCR